MEEKRKADPKLLWVWWIRAGLVTFLFCVITTLIFPVNSKQWIMGVVFFLLVFTILVLWYFPQWWKKYTFFIQDKEVIVQGGVLFTWEKRTMVKQVQFTIWKRSIVERFFGISSIQMALLGGQIKVVGLNDDHQKWFLDQFEEDLEKEENP